MTIWDNLQNHEQFEWFDGKEGETPITAERLNTLEEIIINLTGGLLQTNGQQSGIQAQLNSVQGQAQDAINAASSAQNDADTVSGITSGLQAQLDDVFSRLDALEEHEDE